MVGNLAQQQWGTDAVDAELDRLISKRASQDQTPDPDEREELWKASVRAYNERLRQENRAAWRGWHLDQAERIERTAAELARDHRRHAEELLTDEHPGEGVAS